MNTPPAFALALITLFLAGCDKVPAQNTTESAAQPQYAKPQYAKVVKVEPLIKKTSTPREVCKDVPVTEKAQPKDDKQIAGTVAGAVLGGVLGNQVGGGTGKKLATAAGVVAGGLAGNKVQENMQDKKTVTRTERRCETVEESKEEIVAYEVTYEVNGKRDTLQMKEKPGKQIELKDGKPVDQ